MIETRLETITPELATEYLSHNNRNRTIRRVDVDTYVREIKRGTFVTTHQGIAFDEDGNLIDGQHRLMAIAMAGSPVQMMVTRGMLPSALTVVDRGASRTMRDVMCLEDHGDADNSAMMRSTMMLAAMNQMVACAVRKVKLTPAETTTLFERFAEPALVAYRAGVNKRTVGRSQVVSAAIAAMYCGVAPEVIEKFFNVFHKSDIHGCEGHNAQIVLNWRRQMDDAKLRGMPMNSRKVYLGTQSAIYHFANNTDATRAVVPNSPRYDVSEVLRELLDI